MKEQFNLDTEYLFIPLALTIDTHNYLVSFSAY